MRWARALLVAAILAVLTPPAQTTAQNVVPAGSWLLLSDVHFNPFDDPVLTGALAQAPPAAWHDILARSNAPPSPYLKDTNYALLASALSEMRAVVPNPPVIVIAGDFLAHDFGQAFAQAQPGRPPAAFAAFVDKTIAYLALEFNAAYPSAQFVITLGNNDSYCGDYASTPDSPFLANMAQVWAPLVNRNGRAPDFLTSFPHAGYYIANLPGHAPAQAVIVNSVFWSAKYSNTCGAPTATDPGAAELDWLRAAASTPTAAPRWFLTHIPPGIDAYASARAGKAVPLLHESDAQQFIAIVSGANAHATALIAGHTHHPSFELVGTETTTVPAMIVPSISPVQANNPAFTVAQVDDASGTIADYTTYVYHLPLLGNGPPSAWTREYAFDDAYGLHGFDATNLGLLQTALASDSVKRTAYIAYYNSQSPVGLISAATWPWYWCGDVHLTAQAFDSCIAQTRAR